MNGGKGAFGHTYNPNAGRRTRNFVKLRAAFKEECANGHAVCHLCGQPIDYNADPAKSDDAFNLDHFFPVSLRPDLAEDPANFRPSHRGCNDDRGNDMVQPTLGIPSRVW